VEENACRVLVGELKKEDTLKMCRPQNTSNMSWRERMRRLGLDSTSSGCGQESDHFKHDREISISTNCGEFPIS
jgi:hypothetical protein